MGRQLASVSGVRLEGGAGVTKCAAMVHPFLCRLDESMSMVAGHIDALVVDPVCAEYESNGLQAALLLSFVSLAASILGVRLTPPSLRNLSLRD